MERFDLVLGRIFLFSPSNYRFNNLMQGIRTSIYTIWTNNTLVMLLKIVFSLFVGILIYYEIFIERDFQSITKIFLESFSLSNLYLPVIVILLMPLNWILESLKWKVIVAQFVKLSITDALRIVVVGLSFGILTPSRLGEYAGRFYMMEKGCKWNTISATFVGSLAQNIVTGTIGILSAVYLISSNSVLDKYIFSSLVYLVVSMVIIGLLIFYNVGFFHSLLNKYSSVQWVRKLIEKGTFLEGLTSEDLHKVLLCSAGRYVIYTSQYLILLKFFGINFSIVEASSVVGLLFLIQSGLPLPPIMGVMARGELAITIWSLYTYNTLGIIATTFSLWFINLIVPVLAGLFLILLKKDK